MKTVSIEPLEKEPWVKLPDGKDLKSWTREDEIVYNQINRQTEKTLFYRRTFDYLSCTDIVGDYYEFGCHRCRTFRMALSEARLHNLTNMRFYAFDSFQGLPSAEKSNAMEIWQQGALNTSEKEFMKMLNDHGLYLDKIETIKGFYQESLTDSLQQELLKKSSKIALVTIDCDLYESAVPVFTFIENILQEGAVVYIDDFFAGYKGSPLKGVSQAFFEFESKSQWGFYRHLDIGWWGRSFIVYKE